MAGCQTGDKPSYEQMLVYNWHLYKCVTRPQCVDPTIYTNTRSIILSYINQCTVIVKYNLTKNDYDVMTWKWLLVLCERNTSVIDEFPKQRASNEELWCSLCPVSTQVVAQCDLKPRPYDVTIMKCTPYPACNQGMERISSGVGDLHRPTHINYCLAWLSGRFPFPP